MVKQGALGKLGAKICAELLESDMSRPTSRGRSKVCGNTPSSGQGTDGLVAACMKFFMGIMLPLLSSTGGSPRTLAIECHRSLETWSGMRDLVYCCSEA